MTALYLCWVGKTAAPYARVGVEEYLRRIRRYRDCREIVVAAERHDGRYSAAHRVQREGRRILERIDKLGPAWVAALDPEGKERSSPDFAEIVRRKAYEDPRTPVFVVGGPDGLSSSVRERADELIGLSHMTLPHDMARLFLTEQIYRAMTIINGHPYDR